MKFKNTAEIFAALETYNKQFEAEEVMRLNMLDILELEDLVDEDIPQNANMRQSIEAIIRTNNNVFLALEKVDIDYIEIYDYKCFKAEDDLGNESIYFISPNEILYLENSYIGRQ